ncbi:MAG TPA: copper chaperone PCu(A)C [Rhodoblastus sp.]|nr:copper chaperone PCu(A)C [Rhodoblastus sp.]
MKTMPHRSRRAVSALAGVLAFLQAAGAGAAGVAVQHPWAMATPPKAVVGRAFMTLINETGEVDHLIGATTDVARTAEVSGFRIFDSVPNLRRLVNIDIPAGGKIVFSPGGYHILLRNLKRPLIAGETFSITLTFEKAGVLPVTFTVETPPPSALAPQ